MATSRSRSSISPFRSRRAPPPQSAPKAGGRPATPSSSSCSTARPSTPSSVSSRPALPAAAAAAGSRHPPLSPEASNAKENVSVTVRFRPLSAREINKGDDVSWYADGDHTVRSEHNASIAYGFDRVFGPATTTRHVYDVAAQHVVNGAMNGINGTVFAYGVTSSGKTHTMHGEQKSPGIIPLAIKDVFSIIQETPGREFLLRVSYLEIYNEVINDLLDPAGQNLRIREDSQGTYVEGIKEEVVLSPAHALSLIASGEEHRHVGSNNFNLLSSRSHTMFTLTIESSPSGENKGEEDVILSQLNLIDLAGSESSKTETTGLRRKEGSYINKSLLTLGTVISKLTDGKATHVPYRDSKLTRILQSSLSGHGRISLICTVTPASSTSEETHNTLKFAHRSKYVEIKASQNKIMDEKSLIKKYQREILSLKEELQQLKRGMLEKPYLISNDQEDLVSLKLQLEAGQVKLQSRLEEEEQAKAALLGRIQRLTKLILVSTKNSMPSTVPEKSSHWRRHSFGEDELAYLPDKKREYVVDDDALSVDSEFSSEGKCGSATQEESIKFDKKNRVRGVLGWLKSRTGTTITDQMDLFREQLKMLAGEVALSTSSLKRVSELAAKNPEDPKILEQMQKLKNEISEKKLQMRILEQRMVGSYEASPLAPKSSDMSQALSKLTAQLNEKTFELEVMSADNRILREQLQLKISEISELQETVLMLRQQVDSLFDGGSNSLQQCRENDIKRNGLFEEAYLDNTTPRSNISLSASFSNEDSHGNNTDEFLRKQVLMQASEIENLRQENVILAEEKDGLQIQSQKLSEEASYAKELASAAAVELRNLAEEVTKLSYQNAKLISDLAAAQELPHGKNSQRNSRTNARYECNRNVQLDRYLRNQEDAALIDELHKELSSRRQIEAALEASLSEKDKRETDLQRRLDDATRHGQELESELANMWIVIARLKNSELASDEVSSRGENNLEHCSRTQNGFTSSNDHACRKSKEDRDCYSKNTDGMSALEEVKVAYESERKRCYELEEIISKLKSENLSGLDITALENLQKFHVEALSKICQEKLASHGF